MLRSTLFTGGARSVGAPAGDAGPFGLPRLAAADWWPLWIAALLPVAYAPLLMAPSFSMRFALVLVAFPAGVWTLVTLVRARDVAAVLAAAFCVALLVSALAARSPLLAVAGRPGGHSSFVLYASAIACWALGRGLTSDGLRLLGPALLAASSINVLVGIVQITFRVYGGPLGTFEGRASGLLFNAAFYGSAMAGVASYATFRCASSPSWRWMIVAGWFAFGAAISGSRVVTGALVVVAVAAQVVHGRRAWRATVATALGLMFGLSFTRAAADASVVDRFAAGGSAGRTDVWRFDLRAFLERPLLGWGPGHHGPAVRPHFTPEFTRAYAWEDYLMSWDDPHNIVMLLLVTTGVVGTLLIGAFVVAQIRGIADLAFAAGFVGVAATWLLEPASVHSLPVGMLMLGAAASRTSGIEPRPVLSPKAVSVTFGLGCVLGATFLVPNALMKHALADGTASDAGALSNWVWPDPVVADAVAWKYVYAASDDPSLVEEAIARSGRSTEIEPGRPYFWAEHARRLIELGHYDAVPEVLDQAFAVEPWNPSAWEAQLAYARATRDDELADRTREVICRLDLVLCVTGSRFPQPAAGP